MIEIISTYKYLSVVLIGLLPVIAAYTFFPDQRRMMFLSGFFLFLIMPGVVLYEDEYWSPLRLGGWVPGIEDYILGFSIGSLIWLATIWPSRREIHTHFAWKKFLLRFVGIFMLGSIPFLGMIFYFNFSAILSTVIVQSFQIFVLLALRSYYVVLLGQAIFIYVPYYFFGHFIASHVIPDYHTMWTGTPLLGLTVLGLPIIDEFLWIVSFTWYPLLIAFSADVQLVGIRAGSLSGIGNKRPGKQP